ncbi:MAG TPA: hypothetical protein DDZ60_05475 [Planktothrix sp. UBA10369]|jgi:hypothetical protein|nr:hypothetical protein [Microcoleaceae cyanobacterium UBA11344]HBK21959.1 hypothetical protein [Planktothrix sp. UBA10369]
MTTILSQAEPLYQEEEEFAIVATTFKKRERQKFPSHPIAPVRSVRSDDIAVHDLARSIVGQNVGFVQTLASARRGKFLTPSTNPPSKAVPRSQPKFQKLEADAGLEADEEEPFWRGVFVVPHQHKVLFRKEIEVKTNKLSTWKPNIIIDSYRLEDDDE